MNHLASLIFFIILALQMPVKGFAALQGIISTAVGSVMQNNLPALQASLASPQGVAVDLVGNAYVSDSSHHSIRRIDAGTGTITLLAGTGVAGFSGDGGPASQAKLNNPGDLSLFDKYLYVADVDNH